MLERGRWTAVRCRRFDVGILLPRAFDPPCSGTAAGGWVTSCTEDNAYMIAAAAVSGLLLLSAVAITVWLGRLSTPKDSAGQDAETLG